MEFGQWYTTSNGAFALALATIGADLRGSEAAGGHDPVSRVVTPQCPRGRLVWFFRHEPILPLLERAWNGERVNIPPEVRDQHATLLRLRNEMTTDEWKLGAVSSHAFRDLLENKFILAGLAKKAQTYAGQSTGDVALALPHSWTIAESEDGWKYKDEVEGLIDEYECATSGPV